MTGGKRLSEAERATIMQALKYVRNDYGEQSYVVRSLAILERDDEPEFCTCREGPTCDHGRPGTFSTQECGRCGKPVKEE